MREQQQRGRRRLVAAAAAGAILATLTGPISAASAELPIAESPVEVQSNGHAWHEIDEDLDLLAESLVINQALAGLSISASKDGRLVVSKAYGSANTAEDIQLEPDMQMLMGSTTKALIAGPATFQAMEEAGLEPATTLLYGPDGLFGGAYDWDIIVGSFATGTPIEWYHSITVQHLMDHTAGFAGADTDAAKEMFNVAEEDEIAYELIHKHFLRTQALKWEPGSTYDYENHHIGSLKLVLEAVIGSNAEDFVATEYLGPMGLDPEIEIVSNTPGANASATHETPKYSGPVPFVKDYSKKSGFFAGGYRGSSRDLVELMNHLADRYTPYQLDRMAWAEAGISPQTAWGDDGSGYVHHGGRVKGGTSRAVMSVDGIIVSVQTNKWTDSGPIKSAALEVLDLLRGVEIPEHYDIWAGCTLPAIAPGYSEVARHGVPAGDYQCLFDQMTGAGYRLDWIDASSLGGSAFFNALFVPDGGTAWKAFHGMTGSAYQERFDQMKEDGYRPVQVDSYLSGGSVRYTAIFEKAPGSAYSAYHGLSTADHQARFDELVGKGYRPTSLSVVAVDGQHRYTALYEQGIEGSFLVRSTLSPAEYQTTFDEQRRIGRRPVYLNGYTNVDGEPRLVAIFSSKPEGPFRASHGLLSGDYQSEWETNTDDGYRTEVVTAYAGANRLYFAAIWAQ